MGAWGNTNFANDGAMDFVAGFENTPRASSLPKPMRAGLKTTDVNDWQEALAAAEIVALLNGHPADDVPEGVMLWACKTQRKPKPDLLALADELAEHAIAHGNSPDNLALWRDKTGAAEWMTVQRGLRERLRAAYRPLPEPNREPRDILLNFCKPDHDSIGYGSLMGYAAVGKSFPRPATLRKFGPTFVVWDLDTFAAPADLFRAADWLREQGLTHLRLHRFSGGNYTPNRVLEEFLAYLQPWVEGLDLHIGKCSLRALAGAPRLRTLHVTCSGKKVDFGFQRELPELLLLHLSDIEDFPLADDLAGLTGLQHLAVSVSGGKGVDAASLPPSLEELTLDLRHAKSAIDLAPVFALPKLRQLALHVPAGRARFPAPGAIRSPLEGLDLVVAKGFQDYDLFVGLPALKTLILDVAVARSDLTFLAGNNKLEDLYVSYSRELVDLSGLADFPNLRALRLFHTNNVRQLPDLPKLKTLSLYCRQCSLDNIAAFQSLESIDVNDDVVTVRFIEELRRLPHLKTYDFGLIELLEDDIQEALKGLKATEAQDISYRPQLTSRLERWYQCGSSGWEVRDLEDMATRYPAHPKA